MEELSVVLPLPSVSFALVGSVTVTRHRFADRAVRHLSASVRGRRYIAALAVVTYSISVTPAVTADQGGRYTVYAAGTNSCGHYQADLEKYPLAASDYSSWLAGYLTSFNEYTKGQNDLLEGTDLQGAIQWMANYCRANPMANFADAANALVAAQLEKQTDRIIKQLLPKE